MSWMTDEEEERWIIAHHEAGHVLVAARLRKENIWSRILPKHERVDHAGITNHTREAASTPHEIYRAMNHEMLIAAGGLAAEFALVLGVCGDVSKDQTYIIAAGAKSDLQKMRDIDKEFFGGKELINITLVDYVLQKLILRSHKKLTRLATKLFEQGELSYDEILRITRFPKLAPPTSKY